MKSKNTLLLTVAGILIVIGVIKPDLNQLINNTPVCNNTIVNIDSPEDPILREKAEIIIATLKNADSLDTQKLRNLALDMSVLIGLDGEDLVIKTTEEIRQAVSLSGVMLRMDIKGKYPSLASQSTDVIVAAIGDDDLPLTPDLRSKAVKGFEALAWAYNGGK